MVVVYYSERLQISVSQGQRCMNRVQKSCTWSLLLFSPHGAVESANIPWKIVCDNNSKDF